MGEFDKDDGRVNREKTCPLLLRVFCGNCSHNSLSEYNRGSTPINELQVYTWLDATLRELASLVKQVNSEARRRGTLFDFAIISPDSRSSLYRLRDIGSVCSGFPSDADKIMLKDCSFHIGDMIDVAVTPPANQLGTYEGEGYNSSLGMSRRRADARGLARDYPQRGEVSGGGTFNASMLANTTKAVVSMMTAAAAAAAAAASQTDANSKDPRPSGRPDRSTASRSDQHYSRRLVQY